MPAETIQPPIPTHASKATISVFAESVSKELNYRPGLPIEQIVSTIGGTICYTSYNQDDAPESIIVRPDLTFEIFLSSLTSQNRDRFTIAHELGHLFLHYPLVKKLNPSASMRATRWVDEGNQDLQRCEWEANWFAASFLMPSSEFKTKAIKMDIDALSSHFGVSRNAAEVRKKSLRL